MRPGKRPLLKNTAPGMTRRGGASFPALGGCAPLALMKTLAFVLVAIAVFAPARVDAQPCASACEEFTGSPRTKGKCDAVVTWTSVCLSTDSNVTTYEQVDASTASITKLFGALIPASCRNAGINFVCAGNWRPCVNIPDPTAVPPCRDACENFVDLCGAIAQSLGLSSLLPNCNLFPTTPPSCNPINTSQAIPYFAEDCPYPLVFEDLAIPPDDPTEYCHLQCLWDMYSSTEWDVLFWMMYILGTISLILSSFFSLTRALSFVGRKFPAVLVLWFNVSLVGISLALITPIFVGGARNLLCDDNDDYFLTKDFGYTVGGTFCVLQGMLLQYSTTTATIWWVMVSLNLFEVIVLAVEKSYIYRFYIWVHAFAWGFPLLQVIAGVSSLNIRSRPGLAWCFLDDPDESAWAWAIYFAPLIVFVTVATASSVVTVGKLLYLKLSKKSKVGVPQIVRLGLLVLYFWYVTTFIIVYKIYVEAKNDEIKDALEDQVRCSASSGTDCDLEEKLEYGVFVVYIWNAATCGTMIFLISATSMETVRFWGRFCADIFRVRSLSEFGNLVKYTVSVDTTIQKRERIFTTSTTSGKMSQTSRDVRSQDDDDDEDDDL